MASQPHKANGKALLPKISWKSRFPIFQINQVKFTLSTSDGARAQLTRLRPEIPVFENKDFKPGT